MTAPSGKPDYGLDAPGVVRNLLLAGSLGVVLWAGTAWGLWPAVRTIRPVAGLAVRFPLGPIGLTVAAGCLGMGLWMAYWSKAGKQRYRDFLLAQIPWTGTEHVLDVGCGRGLMLVGAARLLTTGHADGVDIWQAKDLSGNSPEATLRNAKIEGAEDRVTVHTADMRHLPFAAATFDVVLSCAAIHNVPSRSDRGVVIAEITRVLRPGGYAVIDDIRNLGEYAADFAAQGASEVRRVGSPLRNLLLALLTFGTLYPGTLVVRAPAKQAL
jgi:SAM-dependent methyltransferase